MNRKEKTYITILIILAFGLIISIRGNWHFTNLIEKTELKLSEREIELNSVLWASSQCYLYTNSKIKDFNVVSSDGEKVSFSSMLDNSYKEFFKFSSSDCIECVESELQLLKEKIHPTTILVETQDAGG